MSDAALTRLTDRSRRILQLAEKVSAEHNLAFVHPEHLLYGMEREGQAVPAVVLDRLNISYIAARAGYRDGPPEPIRRLAAEAGPLRDEGEPMEVAYSQHSTRVLECALREALQLGHSFVGPEHLLLGMVRGGCEPIWAELGTTAAAVRREVLGILTGYAALPSEKVAAQPSMGEWLQQLLDRARAWGREVHEVGEVAALVQEVTDAVHRDDCRRNGHQTREIHEIGSAMPVALVCGHCPARWTITEDKP